MARIAFQGMSPSAAVQFFPTGIRIRIRDIP